MITLEQLENILVISPHCDDAVFSCGQLLASYLGVGVITVFAGRPPTGIALTEWDRASGFRPDNDVMGIRRAESVTLALEQAGISQQRITTRGFGERYPVAPNTNPDGTDNPSGRERNHRVEVIIENS